MRNDNIHELIGSSHALAMQDPFRPEWLKNLPGNDEPYYRFLYYLMWNVRPEVAVELGVYQGRSLAHMAAGCKGSRVMGVDIDDGAHCPQSPNANIFINDSMDFLRRYSNLRIGVLHIDTIHTPGRVGLELKAALPLMVSPGVICVDDIKIDKEMVDWWDKLDMNKMNFHDLHVTGYGVIIV